MIHLVQHIVLTEKVMMFVSIDANARYPFQPSYLNQNTRGVGEP